MPIWISRLLSTPAITHKSCGSFQAASKRQYHPGGVTSSAQLATTSPWPWVFGFSAKCPKPIASAKCHTSTTSFCLELPYPRLRVSATIFALFLLLPLGQALGPRIISRSETSSSSCPGLGFFLSHVSRPGSSIKLLAPVARLSPAGLCTVDIELTESSRTESLRHQLGLSRESLL